MQGKGIFFPFPGKPQIGQLDTIPKNLNAPPEYMQPFLANCMIRKILGFLLFTILVSICSDISLKDPNFALVKNNDAKNISHTYFFFSIFDSQTYRFSYC